MNTNEALARLIEDGVPDIPTALRVAPLESVRRRAHRSRVVGMVATAATALVIMAGAAVVAGHWRSGSALPPAAPQSTSSTLGPTVLTHLIAWPQARLDRTGRRLTVFVNPPEGDCGRHANTTVQVDERPDKVLVSVTGADVTALDCSVVATEAIEVTLAEPLGNRTLFDARDGVARPVFADSPLPIVPAGPTGWSEINVGFEHFDAQSFMWAFTKAGGPDLHIRVGIHGSSQRDFLQPVTLGSRTGQVFTLVGTFGVQWTNGDLSYDLIAQPSEGETISLAEFTGLVERLTWP